MTAASPAGRSAALQHSAPGALTMRAIVMRGPGGPSVLRLEERARPTPGVGEVLVQVAACGLCGHDQADRMGITRVPLPCVLGHEIAGTVVELGDGADPGLLGRRVACRSIWGCGTCAHCRADQERRCTGRRFLYGGLAEYAAVKASVVVPVPDEMDLVDAAVSACAVATGVQALRSVAAVVPGETVVVTGASGGLGLHALQVARALGARPLAVTTSPSSAERLSATGVEVVTGDPRDWPVAILELTGGAGADVVIDNVRAPEVFRSCFKAIAYSGRYVFTGQVARERIAFYPKHLFGREIVVTGSAAATEETVRLSLEMIADGRVRPEVERFDLDDIVAAFAAVDERRVFGRAVMVF